MKRFILLIALMSALASCYAQEQTVSVQIPESFTLEWMLNHPMGYFATKYISKETMVCMMSTSDSKGKKLFLDSEVKNDNDSYELIGTTDKNYKSEVGSSFFVWVSCRYANDRLKEWSYYLSFGNSRTAERVADDLYKQMKRLGYKVIGGSKKDGFRMFILKGTLSPLITIDWRGEEGTEIEIEVL